MREYVEQAYEYCRTGDLPSLRSIYLEHRMDANLEFLSRGKSMLHVAACHGHYAVVSFLLDQGVSVHARDNGWTPLLFAVLESYVNIIKLLADNRADVNARTAAGESALLVAVENGQYDVARVLLENGADPNVKCTVDNECEIALLVAAATKHDNSRMVLLLMLYGADIKACNESGQNALHVAAIYGNQDVVWTLLNYIDDIDAPDNEDDTALNLAATHGSTAVVELLLRKGANPNKWTLYSPLQNACMNAFVDIVRMLIAAGGSVSARGENDSTALMFARATLARCENSAAMESEKLLLEAARETERLLLEAGATE